MWTDNYVESPQDRIFSAETQNRPRGVVDWALAAVFGHITGQVDHMWASVEGLFGCETRDRDELCLMGLVALRCYAHTRSYHPFMKAARLVADMLANAPTATARDDDDDGDGDNDSPRGRRRRQERTPLFVCFAWTMERMFPSDPNVARQYHLLVQDPPPTADELKTDPMWLLADGVLPKVPRAAWFAACKEVLRRPLLSARDRFCVMHCAVCVLRNTRLILSVGPHPDSPADRTDLLWHVLEHATVTAPSVSVAKRSSPAWMPAAVDALLVPSPRDTNHVAMSWASLVISAAVLVLVAIAAAVWITCAVGRRCRRRTCAAADGPRTDSSCTAGSKTAPSPDGPTGGPSETPARSRDSAP